MNEWIYATGLGMIMIAYSDIIRNQGASRAANAVLQILLGGSYLVFQIWGFFVFDWWVPIFYVIGAAIAVGMIQALIFRGQGLMSILIGVIGVVLCVVSL